MKNLNTYLVGGAVRDFLLKKNNQDRDYVVVGSTPQQMVDLGFRPIGNNFPVFLHPKTKEEYALARTERKTGVGYGGFTFYTEPTVSLKDDLKRRDLTINAIAMDSQNNIIDYYNGQADLTAQCLRHVSPAFSEDPLRVLRVARFASMFPEFTVAKETMVLMQHMVKNKELSHLPNERIWRELHRGFCTPQPSRMIDILAECGALAVILPEVDALRGVPERLDYHPEGETFIHTKMILNYLAQNQATGNICFAALLHDTGKALSAIEILPHHYGHEKASAQIARTICKRLRVSKECEKLAVAVACEHGNIHKCREMKSSKVVDLLTRLDAFRNPQHLKDILSVCAADFHYWRMRDLQTYLPRDFLYAVLAAANSIDTQAIVKKYQDHPSSKIGLAIRMARINAVKQFQKQIE